MSRTLLLITALAGAAGCAAPPAPVVPGLPPGFGATAPTESAAFADVRMAMRAIEEELHRDPPPEQLAAMPGRLAQLDEEIDVLRAADGVARGEADYWLARSRSALAIALDEARRGTDPPPDLPGARVALEQGLLFARRAVELGAAHSDSHRLHGELLGRLIPHMGWWFGVRHGNESREAIEIAVSLDPTNAAARVALGYSFLHTPALFGGDLVRAVAEFIQAIESAGRDVERFQARMGLGLVYLKDGQAEQAVAEFRLALAIFPDSPWASFELSELGDGTVAP